MRYSRVGSEVIKKVHDSFLTNFIKLLLIEFYVTFVAQPLELITRSPPRRLLPLIIDGSTALR